MSKLDLRNAIKIKTAAGGVKRLNAFGEVWLSPFAPAAIPAENWSYELSGTYLYVRLQGFPEAMPEIKPDQGDKVRISVNGAGWSEQFEYDVRHNWSYGLNGKPGRTVNVSLSFNNGVGWGELSSPKEVAFPYYQGSQPQIPDSDWSVATGAEDGEIVVTISAFADNLDYPPTTGIFASGDGVTWHDLEFIGTGSASIFVPFSNEQYSVSLRRPNAAIALPFPNIAKTVISGGEKKPITNNIQVVSGRGFEGSVFEADTAAQWYANFAPIEGQTGTTFTMTKELEGKAIRCGYSNEIRHDTPATLGAVQYYTTRQASSITLNSGKVQRWRSVVLSADSIFNNNSGQQPVYDAVKFNGIPTLTFNAQNSRLNFSKALGANQYTYFVIGQSVSTATGLRGVLGNTLADNVTGAMLPLGENGSADPEIYRGAGAVIWKRNNEVVEPVTRGEAFTIFNNNSQPVMHSFQVSDASKIVTLGALSNRAFPAMQIAEVVIFAGELTEGIHNQMQYYFDSVYRT